jgi:hypothetical protein
MGTLESCRGRGTCHGDEEPVSIESNGNLRCQPYEGDPLQRAETVTCPKDESAGEGAEKE